MGTVDHKRDADKLKPYITAWLREMTGRAPSTGGGGGTVALPPTPPPPLTAHVLATATALGTYHTVSGLTAGQVLKALGPTSAAFGQLLHNQLGGIGPNDHHAQSHVLATAGGLGGDHTISGATVGHVLRASAPDAAAFAQLQHNDLGGVTADQHHNQLHDITDAAHHSIVGSNLDVVSNVSGAVGLRAGSSDVSAGGSAYLYASAGLITLRNINVNGALQSDSANFAIGVNVAPDGAAALDIRAGAISDHSQRIKQISGQTGRLWRIESTSGQELIVLDSVGNLQSGNPGFVSGLTGWRITPTGNAEFNNGRFRGELHATVMVFDEVSVRNGTELITPAGGALELDVTIVSTGTPALRNVRTTAFADQDFLDYRTDSVTGSGDMTARTIENILNVKNPDTGHYQVFRAGEVLRMKVWTGTAVTDTWMRVNSAVDMGTYYAYFVQVMSGTLPVTYTAGAAMAGYGKPGEGAIRLSADDPYGPLIDIFTTGAEPWGADVYPHVRLGRLDGVGVPGLSGIQQYGIALGTNLADATEPYMFASNLGVRQYNIDSAWNDGTNDTVRIEAGGRARFGTNVESAANTFLDINPALGLATFKGAIEVLAGSSGYANYTDKPTLGTMAAIDNSLDNVNNGTTYARVNSTIISGGNIRVGSGTKDSTLNGFHIDSGEIVGQLAGVDQTVMGTDGKIKAGAGAVMLDAGGLHIVTGASGELVRGIRFDYGAATDGGIWGYASATVSSLQFLANRLTTSLSPVRDVEAWTTIEAVSGAGTGKIAHMEIRAHQNTNVGALIRLSENYTNVGQSHILIQADYLRIAGETDLDDVLNIRTTAW